MRFNDYRLSLDSDRLEWLNNIQMETGLNYFGGKSKIGRYLLNQIFNLVVDMDSQGKRPQIFIDSFTGGGKMGLSIPCGWFDNNEGLIVMNDLNWGIYNYYKYCKEDYIALIKMIDKLGSIMSKDFFYTALTIRSDRRTDGLTAAAMTFWVTYSSFNGITSEEFATYALPYKTDANKLVTEADKERLLENGLVEQEAIQRLLRLAHKRIPILHEKLTRQNYVIENLDYRELIKKYNGLPYKEQTSDEIKEAVEKYGNITKLFYFDPPYHPYTLNGGKDAPYADSFTLELAEEMVDILAGEKAGEYGEIPYFIKSDYSLKQTLENAKIELKKEKCSQKEWLTKLVKIDVETPEKVSSAFDKLERYPFCRIPLGSFDKGAISDGEKTLGDEFIWCRGFSKEYIQLMIEEHNLNVSCN